MSKDYYNTLGVGKNASEEDIKRAFRKKAHEFHPDKAGGDEKKFKEANEAYQVLSNKEKRSQYDQFGTTFDQMGDQGGFSGFGGFGGQQGGMHFDMGDLGDIFGDIFGGAGGRARGRERRGRHIEMDVLVSFKEAAFGTEDSVSVYRDMLCDSCKGDGAESGSKMIDCAECGGTGQVSQVQRTILGSLRTARACEKCGSGGKVPEKACAKCGGAGLIKGSKEIKLKIPAGISDGEILRVTGEGEPIPRGGRAGDLYVAVRVKPDPKFQRRGFDIHSREEISVPTAALGGTIEVQTLDGEIKLKIPAGTQPGQVFRLKGKGIPFLKRSGRGEHYVEAKVVVPTKLSKKQRKLFEELQD